MKKNKIEMFLQSEDGKRNAERFIKALKEKRIIACVKHVSSSGMSRDIAFREVVKTKYGYSMLQFDWFFEQLGWPRSKNYDAIRVGGCGMDMHSTFSIPYAKNSSIMDSNCQRSGHLWLTTLWQSNVR